jgi:hypothetical protein
VDHAQPYHAGKSAGRHPLAVLADLSNTDKHRLVNPTYSFIAGDSADVVKQLAEAHESSGYPHEVEFFLAKEGQRLIHGIVNRLTQHFACDFP